MKRTYTTPTVIVLALGNTTLLAGSGHIEKGSQGKTSSGNSTQADTYDAFDTVIDAADNAGVTSEEWVYMAL